MKIFKKVPLIPIVLGLTLIGYALLAYLINKGFFSLTVTVGNIIIGLALVFFAVLVVLPHISQSKFKLATTLWTVEFIVILLAAFIGFILPVFNVKTPYLGSGSLWFGLTLIMEGSINLYLGSINKLEVKGYKFFISLILVIIGTFILSRNIIDANIKIASLVALMLTGLYLVLIGLIAKDRKKNSSK